MSEGAHLSSLQLDELHLGALPAAQAEVAKAHLASCARCAADAAALADSRAQFTAAVLPKTMGAVRRRAEADGFFKPRRSWLAALVVACGAAAALLIAVRKPVAEDEVQAKGGGPVLSAFVQRGGGAAAIADGEVLKPGDSVRLVVQPGRQRFAAVISVDGAGQVTRWFPLGAALSGPVQPHLRTELPGAIVLDRSPGPERIFAFFSATPLPLQPLEARLAALAKGGPATLRSALPLKLDGVDQASLRIEKDLK